MLKSKLAMVVLAAVVAIAPLAVAGSAQAASGSDSFCVLPYEYVDYEEVVYGGDTFLVTVVGSGNSDLDLFVYDEFGNLIASDTSIGAFSQVWVLPCYTQWMTIRVVNNGGAFDCYTIALD
jgi:hypothetical protein